REERCYATPETDGERASRPDPGRRRAGVGNGRQRPPPASAEDGQQRTAPALAALGMGAVGSRRARRRRRPLRPRQGGPPRLTPLRAGPPTCPAARQLRSAAGGRVWVPLPVPCGGSAGASSLYWGAPTQTSAKRPGEEASAPRPAMTAPAPAWNRKR